MKKVSIISLGCSKNLVDSELLMEQFYNAGYIVESDNENSDADLVVVNTCGFIGDAKEESINTILEQVERKKTGNIKKLIVMGCLSERYKDSLQSEIPEIDSIYGKFDWKNMITDLGGVYNHELRNRRILTTPSHYAFVKIGEGCNRTCSYCAIPIITGKYKSKPIEDILEECKELVKRGVKEFLVIAQDLTYYGYDLYGNYKIAELVDRMAKIPGVQWIKLHYAYPTHFPVDLLKVIRENDNVCKYLDIALQHCSDHMLKQMRRGINKTDLISLINLIRKEVPNIYLRTTMMVGHPGETAEDFKELVEFILEMKFERMGVFAYSHEEDTYCDKHYKDDIPQEVKQVRVDELMEVQRNISEKINELTIGRTLKVIVDSFEDGNYIGRSEHDSPEVDPLVIFTSDNKLEIGNFYDVEITGFDEYDLFGKLKEV